MTTTEAPLYDLGRDRPAARIGVTLSPVLAVVGVMVLVVWGVTEWVAWRFGFHPNLGPAVFAAGSVGRVVLFGLGMLLVALAVGGVAVVPLRRVTGTLASFAIMAFAAASLPVYPPWSVFVWGLRFGDTPSAEPIFSVAWHAIVIPAHLLFVVAMYMAWRRARRSARATDAHGSARWATAKEVEASELLGGEGVFLGVFQRDADDRGVYLRHAGPQHVLGFAPTRSGKGVGWVLPTLLTWRESALIFDVKGENWSQSAGWRAQALGNRCLRFDPTCADGTGARYNPLLEVRRGPLEVRDVQNIADMLVDPDGRGAKDHWDLTAEEVLVGTILHVLYVGQTKTLRGCLELLTDPGSNLTNVLSEMKDTIHDPRGERGWIDALSGKPTCTHPVVASVAQSILNKSDNERSSVISSAVKCLSLFRDDVVAANTERCDFAIADLIHHSEPVSLYLVVPPSDLSRTRPLLRLLINQIGRRLTEQLDPERSEEGRAVRRKLLLMMDEFPTLGRLDFFQTQLAYLAGYGIKAFLIIQDLTQLYAAYGQHESIVSNCHVRVAFAPNKIETAQLLSSMAGVMTVQKARRMYSGNRLAPWLSHVMESEEESQRPLLTPDEALRLPDDHAVVFVAGGRPIWAKKARFYEDRRLLERSTLPPPECRPIEHEWDLWEGEVMPPTASKDAVLKDAALPPTHGGKEEGLDTLLDEGDGEAARELSALV